MAVSSTSNTALNNLTSNYTSTTDQGQETLGREEFLTLLVAQLENQDPLAPQEGTDFTAQLAQYSQLEQLMNLNDSMESMAKAFQDDVDGDGVSYIGKEITGYIDSMQVSKGTVTSGFYSLSSAAEVIVEVYDADGNKVDRLLEGQKSGGGQLIAWDGTDAAGESVDDGTYTYKVYADYGDGFEEVTTTVTGTVDGITYNDGTPYLVVQGVLVALDDVTSVTEINSESDTESIMDYLGKGVKTETPIVLIEDGEVFGQDLSFELDSAEPVTVNVYNAYDELVKTIEVKAEDLKEGTNTVHWNGLDENGGDMPDGLYYYTVKTDSGEFASTAASEKVSAIKNVNNTQYLVLEETGRLVALSTIKEIY